MSKKACRRSRGYVLNLVPAVFFIVMAGLKRADQALRCRQNYGEIVSVLACGDGSTHLDRSTIVSTAVLKNFNKIEQHIYQFREGKPASRTVKSPNKAEKTSKYSLIAQAIEDLSEDVKTNWNGFSPDQKESLRKFAYWSLGESESQERPVTEVLPKLVFTTVKLGFKLLKLKLRGEYQELMLCVDKLDTLVDNILDAIEKEDPLYQTVLVDTLEELKQLKFNPEN